MIKVSVIICTHNRAEILDKVLSNLISQTLDFSFYEIIVVDNASTDNTKKIVEKYSKKFTNLKYIYEPKLGLSRARNRGVKEARGKIITFIDDDAIPVKNWIEEHLKTYEKFEDTVAVGGKVLLKLPERINLNKFELIKDHLGYFNLGDKIIKMKWPDYPRGCNFSIMKEKITGDILFNEKLFLYNDEQFFFYKEIVTKNSFNILYNPYALVFHLVPMERLTIKFFLKRYFYQGVSDRIMEKDLFPQEKLKKKIKNFIFNTGGIIKRFFIMFNPFIPNKLRVKVLCELFRNFGYLIKMLTY